MFNSVLDTPFFSDIEISDRAFVESFFTERIYRKYQVVFYQNDPANEMYFVKSGVLKIYREDDHNEIVLGHQFPGESIGELEAIHHDNHRLASVAAIENSVLWMIRKPDLEQLMSLYPSLLRKFFFVMAERLRQADSKISYLAFLDARFRVVNLLLDLHTNFGSKAEEGILINWKITQTHFANMIGISRESAARTLQELQKDRIISIKDKYITILNLLALQEMSGQIQQSQNLREWHSTYRYDTNIL
ncbi:Crp/Fnr family transcriptional regulator [Brevibacillus panacihumi]|uniref:Crp/Fnr family transcriptional regulator n=1 Tax=Brevibacillus panacihumi TaxID=497735 RepID=UPI003CFBFB48